MSSPQSPSIHNGIAAGDAAKNWRLRLGAVLVFGVVSMLVMFYGRGERSGWLLMTSPTGIDHHGNLMIGYSFLHGGEPFMKENIPTVAQVGAFSGAPDAYRFSEFREDFRLLRALYGMLASVLTPFLGAFGAMLALNWLSWALCAAIAWQFTRELFADERAAFLAVVLVAGAIGMTAHVGDYSPHLLAFAGYYLGIYLLYRSGVYCERRPLRTHLALAIFMGIVCLAYNSGVMLLGVYVLVAILYNRWWHVGLALVVGLASRPLWHRICLAVLPNMTDVEAEYLERSLGQWRELFGLDVLRIGKTIALWISEFFFFFDSPLVVILGLLCCLRAPLPRATRWFLLCCLTIPILASLVFAPSAGARGYLIFGITLWIYVLLSRELVQCTRSDHALVRRLAYLVTALVLVTHCAWGSAHMVHSLGPLKTYFLGWDKGVHYFLSPKTVAMSFTGQEPVPVCFGGEASLSEAGALVTGRDRDFRPEQVSWGVAFGSRLWFFGWFILLAIVVARGARRKTAWAVGLVVLLLGSSYLSWATFRTLPAFFHVPEAVKIPAGGALEYRVTLAPQVLERLRHPTARQRTLAFLCHPVRSELVREFYAGETRIEAEQIGNRFIYEVAPPDRQSTLDAIARAGELRLVVTNPTDRELYVAGWQRSGLPARECQVVDAAGEAQPAGSAWPALELRLLRANGQIDFVAF